MTETLLKTEEGTEYNEGWREIGEVELLAENSRVRLTK